MVAIDPSTPPIVGASAASLQTPVFSPPAGSLLVACVHTDPGRTVTISNTVATGLTWNLIFNVNPGSLGSVHARYAYLPGGATNMSVSAAGSVNNDLALQVYVITGADTATPIGATSTGSTDTTNTITKTLVPQVANSMGFIVAEDFTNAGTTTSSNTTFSAYDVFQNIAGGSGYRLMGAAGGTESFTVDAAGTAASAWVWGVFEIRNAPTPVATQPASILTHGTARRRASLW